jgi:putative membrane protein
LLLVLSVLSVDDNATGEPAIMSENARDTLITFWLLTIFIFAPLLTLLFTKLYYKSYLYELTDSEIRQQFGVINKKYVAIPYARIQNVDIYRGILDRLTGISQLRIQTAGTLYTEGSLPGLSQDQAVILRDDIMKKVSVAQSQKATIDI